MIDLDIFYSHTYYQIYDMDSGKTLRFDSQIANLSLEIQEGKLCTLYLDDKIPDNKYTSLPADVSENVAMITKKLETCFSSASSFKSIPLSAEGTSFQKSVLQEITKLPLGETCTYGEIAKKLYSSARAVGNACRRNSIQIIVPYHRVISAKGIGGYAGKIDGENLSIKHWLLRHEGVQL